MLKTLLGGVWRRTPGAVRRWGVWFIEPRFAVTAGAVITDERGRVLLLKHVFRKGSGWGIPGGFIAKGEHPEEAVRREVREETGLELDSAELAFVRTLKRPQQVEIIYRCRVCAPRPDQERPFDSFEIKSLAWFALDDLPAGISIDQRRIIDRVLAGGGGGSSGGGGPRPPD